MRSNYYYYYYFGVVAPREIGTQSPTRLHELLGAVLQLQHRSYAMIAICAAPHLHGSVIFCLFFYFSFGSGMIFFLVGRYGSIIVFYFLAIIHTHTH